MTTEQAGQPVAVYYRDAGTWNYAGLIGVGSADSTYGIARRGNDFILAESSGAQRVLRMSIDGAVTPLATPLTNANFKGSSTTAPNIQGIAIGPDNMIYYATSFGTPAGNGIWRSNLDGSGLTQIIPSSLIPGTNWNIRDLAIADIDNNATNGFDVFFGTRGGFADANRPYFHVNVNGSTVTNVETLTSSASSPSTVFYDSTTNKVYLGKTSGGAYQIASVNPTGANQTPAVVYNATQVAFDMFKIGSDVFALSADAAGAGTFRYVTGPNAGSVYLDMAAVSGGAVVTGRQAAIIDPSELTTVTWDGGGTSNNLSSGGNYVGDVAPNFAEAAGFAPRVVFAGNARLNPTNDVVGGRIGSITFDATAGAFTLGGNGFTIPIAGGLTNLSTATQTVATSAAITVTGGAVNALNGAIVINSDVNVAAGGLMTLAGAADISFNGKVSGSGNIDKTNTGALNLANAANDFTGRLTITRGKLIVDSVESQSGLGAAGSTLAVGGGTADGVIELSNDVSISKTITLSGRVAQPAPAAADTYLPQIRSVGGNNSVGTLTLNSAASAVLQSDAGTLTVNTVENRNGTTGGAVLRVQGAGNTAINGTLGGGSSNGVLSIVKTGAGTLDVSNVTYGSAGGVLNIGGYTIQNGAVVVNAIVPSAANRLTAIQIDSGGTFDAMAVGTYDSPSGQSFSGSGTIKAGTLNVYEDNAVRPGDQSTTDRVGTLRVQGNLSVFNAFGSPVQRGLYYDINSSPAATSDRIDVTGDLALSSSAGAIPLNVYSVGGTYASGSYRLIDVGGTIAGGTSSFNINLTGGAANYRQTFTVDATSNPKQVNLVVGGVAKTLIWKGDGAGTGDRFDVNNTSNFVDGVMPEKFFYGDTVRFVDDPSADTTAVLQAAVLGRIEVDATQAYTIKNIADYDTATAGNQISGLTEGSVLVKRNTGTLTLDATGGLYPNWNGSLIINGGVVNAIGALGGLAATPFGLGTTGQAATVLDGGTLRLSGTGGGTSNRTFTLGANGGTLDTQGNAAYSLGSSGLPVLFTGDGDRTVTFTGTQSLTFGGLINNPTVGAVSIVKSGVNAMTLNNAQGYNGTLTVNGGRLAINKIAGLGSTVAGTTVNSGGGLYILAGAGSFTSAEALSIAGVGPTFAGGPEASGALRIGGANSNVKFTASVNVPADVNVAVDDASSSLTFAGNVSGAGGIAKVGGAGKMQFGGGTSGSLRIGGGLAINNGPVAIDTQVNAANKVGGLTLGAGASLDMVKSKLVIDYVSGSSPIDAINAALVAGRNGNTWDGNGIRSSFVLADSRYGVGVVEASAVLGGSTNYFGLTDVDNSALIISVTLKGDADVNNVVDFGDLLRLAKNYNGTGKSWSDGDSDYDGVVNFNDLLALAKNYNSTAAANQGLLSAVGGNGFVAEWALAQSLVPEPATISICGMAFGVLARRRRHVCSASAC